MRRKAVCRGACSEWSKKKPAASRAPPSRIDWRRAEPLRITLRVRLRNVCLAILRAYARARVAADAGARMLDLHDLAVELAVEIIFIVFSNDSKDVPESSTP